MSHFIAYFAQRDFLARIITIMVLAIGIGSLNILKLQELPDIAFPEVAITTEYPGASAQDVELNITNKVEKEIRSVQGIERFTSSSINGLSSILLELDESGDIDDIVKDIQQAVDRVSDLPKDISDPPRVEAESTSTFEIFTFGVTGPEVDIFSYARDLEKQVRNVAGVGDVVMMGFREREFWIEVNPHAVRRYQLTYDEVISAIETRNLSLSGGLVESQSSEQRLVTLTQVHSTKELEETIVKVLSNGTLVRVGDIATVSDTYEKATELSMVNGEPAVIFQVSKSDNADIRNTIDNVNALFEREAKRLNNKFAYPVTLDLGQDMDDKFSIVSTNGGVGLLLVLIVLSLVLKRQIAFWVSVSIPFCVLGVIAFLPVFGMSLDSITLSALLLVIGIIVDDSVIIAESIYQEKERGLSAIDAAVQGTVKVYKPILASLTTTALVFIPMFFIPGTLGLAVVVIPITVLTALLLSLVECTLTLPAHLANSLEKADKKANKNKESKDHFNVIISHYQRLLAYCLNWKKSISVAAIVMLGLGGTLGTLLKVDLFPAESAKYIEVYTEVTPGTPLSQVPTSHERLIAAINALPANERASFELTYSSPTSRGLITLTNAEERERSADEISAALNESLKNDAAIKLLKFTVDAGGPPPGEPVEIRVIGINEAQRNTAVLAVQNWMIAHAGLDKVTHSEALKDPQLQIKPQYEWLARYGLTVDDLATTLRIAFDGDSVSTTWLGDEEVNLRVLLDNENRQLAKLRETKIYTATGEQIPLSRLAKIVSVQAPREILHFNGDRQVLVTAQIIDDELTPGELSNALTQALQGQVSDNIRIEIGGEAEETNETLGGIAVAFPAAMLGIYFVLAVMFGSLLQPLLVMAVIPFSLVAALFALFIHISPLSMFAIIGMLGMTGVVVNNALVLINRINELRNEGLDAQSAVLNASVGRLRPIMLTSITTVVGLIPLAYGFGGSDVYMGPMSLTLGYGLLFSLPVVLIVLPCFYLTFFGKAHHNKAQ